MQKVSKIILAISVIANIIFAILYFKPIKLGKPEYNSKEYLDKIDSLESVLHVISNRKDSIQDIIDTVYINLNKNEKDYEEIRDIIINNSIDDDYIFFSNYLQKNRARLDSISNILKTTQGN